MMDLAAFEGITGYRWGALWCPRGNLQRSENAPPVHDRKVALIEQVLANATLPIDHANFVFNKGRVLLRRGSWGLLLLFCAENINVPMVDIIIDETHAKLATDGGDLPSSGSQLSLIHNLSDSSAPIPGDVFAELLDMYVSFLGPLAQQLAHKDIAAADLDVRHIPTREWSNLLNILAARFDDMQKRDAFLDQAVLLKTRF